MEKKIIVFGASGAIGQALARELEHEGASVYRLSRSSDAGLPSFDLSNEASMAQAAISLREQGPFQWMIDATGALTIDGRGPEKSLASMSRESLARAFELNTIGPALLIKHFAPLLAPGKCIYGKLSARVGSISDNNKGGWYGYRASKAAVNMLLQTAALELQRKNPECRVVALQPGTVRSKLSTPFSANVEKLLEPEDSARGLIGALRSIEVRLERKSGADFVDYQGQAIPW